MGHVTWVTCSLGPVRPRACVACGELEATSRAPIPPSESLPRLAAQIRASVAGKLVADKCDRSGPSGVIASAAVALSVYTDFIIEPRGGVEIKSKGLGERSGPIY